MHVAHVDPHLWQPGGITTTLVVTTAAQRDLGLDVTFIGPPGAAAHAGTGVDADATVEWDDAGQLDQIVSRVGADVVHLHGAPRSAPGHGGPPVVITIHDHNAYCPSGSKFFSRGETLCPYQPGRVICTYGHLVRRCGSQRPQRIRADLERWQRTAAWMVRADAVVAYNDFLRRGALTAGTPEARVHVLDQPVVVVGASPPASASPPRVAFLGRIVPNKGLCWLLEALALADASLELDVLGEGRDEGAAHATIERLGLGARVRMHGWVAPAERDRLVSGCRAVVVPSLWPEPAGGVALEAMASGRPVIASAVGGLLERVRDGEAGFLVPAGDRGALSAALDRVVTEADRLDDLGACGRRVVLERHRPEQHAAALLDLYRSVV